MSRLARLVTMLSAFTAAMPLPARAQHADPLVTDRPDFTESAVTVAPRRLQIESGYTRSHSDGDTEHAAGELLVRLGIYRRVELRLALNSYVWAPGAGDGWEDASIGTKVVLSKGIDGSAKPATALLVASTVPVGGGPLRVDYAQPEMKLALSWTAGSDVGLGANLNIAAPHDGSDRYVEPSGSVTVSRSVGERMGTYLELFGFAPSSDREHSAFLNGGITFLLNADLQLDARLGHSVAGATRHFFGVGLSRRL